jgi:opacity protein-like surface antigen
MTLRRALFSLLALCTLAAPASAQPAPSLAIRPFALFSEQSFAAKDTFEATFGQRYQPFFGGGVDVVFHDRLYVTLAASRFKKDGQRAFRSGGVNYELGIPLTATITPIELTGGYRFHLGRNIRPYVGAGVGSWSYKETSGFANAGDDVDTRHVGFVADAGAEFHVAKWIRLGADAEYTHVPGILGQGGISQPAGEDDLGGVAARLRVIVGR